MPLTNMADEIKIAISDQMPIFDNIPYFVRMEDRVYQWIKRQPGQQFCASNEIHIKCNCGCVPGFVENTKRHTLYLDYSAVTAAKGCHVKNWPKEYTVDKANKILAALTEAKEKFWVQNKVCIAHREKDDVKMNWKEV